MAPGTRRANRGGYADHDDFEGLPVRQWRHEWADVAPPLPAETTRKDDIWSIELRWGMPRDTGLLPSHSQELLRAARSGRLYKRPAPAEEEEAEPDAAVDKPEKKEDEAASKGFQVKVWKQANRNTDESPVSHLAKRRKNVVTISSKTVTAQPTGATVTRATVRRTDAAGNPYTQEITLQEGQAVDGEIISTAVVPVAAVNELAQPTPPRNRRPPPPKKNKKLGGPGRGRKKKMLPVPAPVPGQEGAVDGAAAVPKLEEGAPGDVAIKREDSNNPDSEMADNDDDEGDEDGEEGDEEEGEEGDDNNTEDQDQEMRDASPPAAPASADTTMEMTDVESPLADRAQPPNPLLAPPVNHGLSISEPKLEGSPLKNVTMPSPTETSHNITSPPLPVEAPPSLPETSLEEAVAQDAPVQDTVVQDAASAQEGDLDTATKSPVEADKPAVETEASIAEATTLIPPPDQIGNITSPEPAPEVPLYDETVAEASAAEPEVPAPVETAPTDEKPSEPPTEEASGETKEEPSALPPADVEPEPAVTEAPAPEVVPELMESTPTVDKEPSSGPEPEAAPAPPGPVTLEEGPDLLSGLESALDQQNQSAEPPAEQPAEEPSKEPAEQPAADIGATAGSQDVEVKEEPAEDSQEAVKEEPKEEPTQTETKTEDVAPAADSGDADAPTNQPAETKTA